MPAPSPSLPDLSSSYVIITGANTGIGKETARGLAKAGARLCLACRSEAKALPVVEELKAESGNDNIEFRPLDLGDFDSVRAFAAAWLETDQPLDLLINNAGLATPGLTKSGFELHFGVNHLGHFLLTELLLDRLKSSAPSRVVHVASKVHYNAKVIPWDTLQEKTRTTVGMDEYGVSKLANVLYGAELARRLEGTGVSVASLHPGVVASEIWRRIPWPVSAMAKWFMISSEEGAQTSLHCATSPEVIEHSGAYWDECKRRTPSKLAQDEALQDELVARSREWVGLS